MLYSISAKKALLAWPGVLIKKKSYTYNRWSKKKESGSAALCIWLHLGGIGKAQAILAIQKHKLTNKLSEVKQNKNQSENEAS